MALTRASTKGPHPAAVETNPTLTNRVTHKMTYEHQSSHHAPSGRAAGIGTEAATSFGLGRTRRVRDGQLSADDGAFDGLREIAVRGVGEGAYDFTSRVARRRD